MMSQDQEIRNNFESKVSMKIESNSKGYNTTVHLYEGCTEEQYKETASRTVLAFKFLQEEIIKELPNK